MSLLGRPSRAIASPSCRSAFGRHSRDIGARAGPRSADQPTPVAVVRVPEDGDDLTMTDDPDELIACRLRVARMLDDVVAGSHQVAEGGGLLLLDTVGVFLLFTWIGTAGMLAFLLAAGWYLRLVRPIDAGPVRFGRPLGPARPPRSALAALVAIPRHGRVGSAPWGPAGLA